MCKGETHLHRARLIENGERPLFSSQAGVHVNRSLPAKGVAKAELASVRV